jgi:hypothetical protein
VVKSTRHLLKRKLAGKIMEVGFDWRRERVGRTLTTMEEGMEKE